MSNQVLNTTKWTSTAGPRQTKAVSQALNGLRTEINTHTEICGVVGGDESRHTYYSPFGRENQNQAAIDAYNAICERFEWSITRENHQDIIKAVIDILPSVITSRPIIDSRRTPEEESQRIAEMKAREEEARKKREYEGETKYFSTTETAKLIRERLKAEFPGQKFSVVSDQYAGGSSIDIRWTDGPTYKEVDSITGLYSGRGFDGMTDSSYCISAWMLPDATVLFAESSGTGSMSPEYAEKPHPKAVKVHFGASYVNCSRHYSVNFLAPIAEKVAKDWGVPIPEILTGYDQAYVQDNGERIGGGCRTIAQLVEHEAKNISAYVKPEQPNNPGNPPASGNGIEIRHNTAQDGIEIRFDSKPSAEVLNNLKLNGWRWSRHNSCWYKRNKPGVLEFAQSIAGIKTAA